MIDVPIQVKDALREGRLRKNYRFQVLNDDGTVDFTIDNDNLVSESVNIDERMCSGDKIKYGLCEGSSLEFQYFGKENITGRQLKVFVDVNCAEGDYTNVGQFERMEIITITDPGNYRVYSAYENAYDYVWVNRGGTYTQYSPQSSDNGTEVVFYDLQVGDELEVEWSGHIYDTYLQKGEWHPIPMGYFTVKNCSRQASTGIIKVTAYNKLMSNYLESKANNLLLEDFSGDPSVSLTLYDIQRHLLENYEVIERPKQSVPIPDQPDIGTGAIYTAMYLSSDSDIDTPLSAYEYDRLDSQMTHVGQETWVFIDATYAKVTTPSGKYWEIEFLKGDIDAISESLMNYVEGILAGASFWKNSTGGSYTSAQIHNMAKSMPFFIEIDNTTYYLTENPSQKLKEINNVLHYGASTIIFAVPKLMGFHKTNDVTVNLMIDFTQQYTYHYWERASQSSLRTVTKTATPNLKFSDGTDYTTTVSDIFSVNALDLSDAEKTTFTIGDMPEFTLRDIMTANYETVCQFGKLDRGTDLFGGVELNNSRLLPADTLYPDNALYPDGAQESAFKSQYSKLWADEGNVRKWRYLIITYKGLDENQQETDFTLQRTVNADGTDDYNCSNNWLFRNLIWTAADIGSYADAMALKMRDITWFPFEMWCAGLPYLETGDEIEIPLGEDTYTSYILQRQLKGIQNLQDTYINGTLDIF